MSENVPETFDWPYLSTDVPELADTEGLGSFILADFSLSRALYVFQEGIIRSHRQLFLFRVINTAYHWADVRTLNVNVPAEVYNDAGSVVTQFHYRISLRFSDGQSCKFTMSEPQVRTLAKDFYYYGPRMRGFQAGIVFSWIRDRIGEAQFSQLKPRLEAGGKAKFGPISATVQGLTIKGKFFPWSDVSSLWSGHYIDPSLQTKGAVIRVRTEYQNFQLPMRRIDNLSALHCFYEAMKSSSPLTLKTDSLASS